MRAAVAQGAKQGIKAGAALLDLVRRPPVGVVVLIYHRVGGRRTSEIDLPTANFDRQMAWLAANVDVLTLDQAVERVAAGGPVRPAAVVTFDDGTDDLADEVLPVLVRHGVPATYYVATRFVDEQVPFPHDGRPATWAMLAEAVSTGLVTVGSHTHTHALLDRLDPAAVADELDRSIGLIGEHLGVKASHFAYPKAVPGSSDADAAVRARFASAAVAGTRPNRFGQTDVHRLARTPIQVSDGWRWFQRKAAGGLRAEDDVRALANRIRYRDAVT